MATGGDDFGEVIYTGNAGAGGFGSEDPEDPYSAGAAQVTTEAAGAPVAAGISSCVLLGIVVY